MFCSLACGESWCAFHSSIWQLPIDHLSSWVLARTINGAGGNKTRLLGAKLLFSEHTAQKKKSSLTFHTLLYKCYSLIKAVDVCRRLMCCTYAELWVHTACMQSYMSTSQAGWNLFLFGCCDFVWSSGERAEWYCGELSGPESHPSNVCCSLKSH